MKQKFPRRVTILIAVLGVLGLIAALGPARGVVDDVFGLTSQESGQQDDEVKKGKLAAEDLNDPDEPGRWFELPAGPPQTSSDNAKPRVSSAFFVAKFVCHKESGTPEVIAFEPAHDEARTIKSGFRRKDNPGNPNAAKGLSKLLGQRLAEFESDGGGGPSGPEKAKAVLDQLRGIIEDPDCTKLEWQTQDPPSPEHPQGVERTWDVVTQPDPDLGDSPGMDGKKNALHFRTVTTISGQPDPDLPEAEPQEITIENDIIIIRRGRVLLVMTETSPGGHPNAADEAKKHAGKADTKMKNAMTP